jgi:GNAT superfamily N-acetyltransferase
MIIRPAGTGDAEDLARLRWEFRSGLGQPEETTEEFQARCHRWMRERLDGPAGWRCWVAEESGEVVGSVWLQLIEKLPNPVVEPERHAYISSLYVRPTLRGQGTGSALLAAALEACRVLEVDAVILWPTEGSRRLYARHGFAVRDDVMERRG